MTTQTSDLIGQRKNRIEKLNKLRDLGIDPYPSESERTHNAGQIQTNFENLQNETVLVAGRIINFRKHGKLTFADIEDESGVLQLYIKSDELGATNIENQTLGYEDLTLLDSGDFVQVKGYVTKTDRGEVSVCPAEIKILSKALRPLPRSGDEMKDKEERFRRRYVDMAVHKEVRDRMSRRSKFWQAHRDFLNNKGFIEINIPILEHIPGGGDAVPFVTHMNAIDEDFYLRISHELPLKRLIGGGFEKVYDIGARFRNEGLSDEHLPEHVAMEFYWAYANWKDGMELVQDLFNYVIEQVYPGQNEFQVREFTVKFGGEWERIDFNNVMNEHYGIADIYNVTMEELTPILEKEGIDLKRNPNIPRAVDSLWKKIRKTIAGPAFLINHPKYLSPLQKPSLEDPRIVERFQPIIAGSELGNGWSEVNDAIDQFDRFMEQQKLRDAGDDEAQWLDIDYVEMLEYGMPPTLGWGHSERLFWFLENVTAREGVPFPQLKFHVSDLTKKIYPEVEFDRVKANDENTEDEVKPAQEEPKTRKEVGSSSGTLPTRQEAKELLEKHVKDDYQKLHAHMVADAMEAYAKKFGEDAELWYLTGLLHDLDYFEHPEEHPNVEATWFKELGYPEELIHAVAAHGWQRSGIQPETKLDAALIACDELCGFLYAYSLMRPDGYNGMDAKGVKKRFKDKNFAKKISREEIMLGVEKLGVDFSDHANFLIEVFQNS